MAYTITTTYIPLVISGTPYSYTLTTSGSGGTKTFSETGTLPSGMSFNTSTGVLDGTIDDDLSYKPTFEVYNNGTPSGNPQALYIKVVEPLDTFKTLVGIMGDSQSNSSGLNQQTEGIKYWLNQILPADKYQICVFGFDGYEINNIQTQYTRYLQGLYNATRPANICIWQGGINDIAFSGLSASAIAARMQTAINASQADGFITLFETVPAWDSGTANDTLRLSVNTNYAGLTSDGMIDIASLSEFNQPADAHNTTYYQIDLVHRTSLANKKVAIEHAKKLGTLAGAELAACWCFFETDFVENTNYAPVNIPFGSGTKTWNWKVDGVSVSTSQNPTLSFTGGNHTVRLEVTVGATTVFSERTIFVALDGDVGTGAISPSLSTIAYGGNVVLTASGLTSPIWRVVTGSGSLSGSGSSRTYTDASPNADAIIVAAEDAWGTAPGGTSVNSSQQWVVATGTPTISLVPLLNGIGDEVSFYLPANFANGILTECAVGLVEQAAGRTWRFYGDGNVKENSGSGETTVSGGTISFTTNTKITFKRISTGVSTQGYAIYKDGVFNRNFTVDKASNSFKDQPQIYDDGIHATWTRPDFKGATIYGWNQGTAQVTTLAAPVAAFSLNGLTGGNLEASDTLTVSDSATDATTYQYKVDGLTRSNSAEPDLTRYINAGGSHTVEQTVTNSIGSDSTSITFDAVEKIVDAGLTTSYSVAGVPTGLDLTLKVRSVDGAGNPSTYSNSVEVQT